MKIETFLEKFDQLADAPNAVEKIRELVLRLAMGGKLVEQDSTEPSGAEVFDAIQQFREKQPKSGKVATSPKSWVVAGDDIHLPSTWWRCAVEEVCNLKTGATPSTQEPRYFGGTIRWLVSGDINQSEIFECAGRISELGIANSNCKVVPRDSVLIALNGQGKTRATVALLRVEATLNQSLVAMTPYSREHLLPEFLFWNLRGRYRAIRDVTGQDQRRGLNMKLVGQLSLPLPPIGEQRRIVARIGELMRFCDKLEEQQREREARHAVITRAAVATFNNNPTSTNLSLLFHKTYSVSSADLRKTILSLAVQGKLVPFRNIHTRDEVGDHVEFLNGYAFKSEWFRAGGVRLCRNANVGHGELDWRESVYVDESTARDFDRFSLYEGDVVVSLDRPLISTGLKVAKVKESDLPCLLLQRVAKPILRHNRLTLDYFYLWLNSPAFINSINPGRSNGVPHISTRQIQKIRFVLPDIDEQRSVVAQVEHLLEIINKLEAQIIKSQATARQLLDTMIDDVHKFLMTQGNSTSNRETIGCYVIRQLGAKPNFGRTMLMKVFYLSEAHLGISQGWQPMRQAAGPYDPSIEDFESLGVQSGWFTVKKKTLSNGHEMVQYQSKSGMEAKIAEAVSMLSGQKTEFDRLLNLFQNKTTEEAEIIATLFAAWNDLLIDGKSPSDDEIIREVRENWHYKKERFTPVLLTRWLNWLRQQSVIPRGLAPRTRQQLKLGLG
jgi:type I restriction enzyme S subunit